MECNTDGCVSPFWPLPSSTLIAPAAPKFTREPSDVAVEIGSNVTLVCLVQGHPEPQVNWRREDGLPLHTRNRAHGTITQSKGGLQITGELFSGLFVYRSHMEILLIHAQISIFLSGLWVEDEAVYVCEAHNHFGKIETQARITVTGLGKCKIWRLSLSDSLHGSYFRKAAWIKIFSWLHVLFYDS